MAARPVVLAVGGAVLRSRAELAAAVDEVYRHLRGGRRVRVHAPPGEATAALAASLEAHGVPARLLPDGDTAADPVVIVQDPSTRGPASPAWRPARPLRVVLLGLGTVGRGVHERLAAAPDRFELVRAVVRRPAHHAERGIPRGLLSSDPWDAVAADADLVVEALGGAAPAGDVLLAALLAGRQVVSANKAALAARWAELEPFTRGEHPTLRLGAAVGGAVPVLEHLARARRGPGVTALRGVLNGTCNFVLGRIEAGRSYADALAEAQRLGFAEPDPSSDVSGEDAAHKVRLCAAVGLGALPVALEVRGIARLEPAAIARARAEGRTTKLVAEVRASRSGPVARVAPERLAAGDFLAGARDEENRVELTLRDGRVLRLAGKGAGRWPTTAAVMGDVLEVERELRAEGAPARTEVPSAA